MGNIRFWGSFLVILGLIAAVLPLQAGGYSGYPLSVGDTKVADALNYLRGAQEDSGSIGGFGASGWVIMAIAAAGEDPHSWKTAGDKPSVVDYLEDNVGEANLSIATDVERMILAVVAADENPGNFGGVDFVAALEALYDGTQVGDAGLLNDDFWAVLALLSAGESPGSETITSLRAFITGNQNGDGGWSWGVGGNSDVDDTAVAIMALIAAGESPGSAAVTDGLSYIKSQQADNGGFLSWGATNADTDSWAIDAIAAAGQDPTSANWTENGTTPVDDLLCFQQPDGSFYWQDGVPGMSVPGTTASAILALLGRPYPVTTLELEQLPLYVRVEGQDETVWRGEVIVSDSWITADNSDVTYHLCNATALGALDEASGHEGRFPYYATDEWGGLYVSSIAGEAPAGMSGWMYRVDCCSPMVGADQFILNETHSEVLWYYGDWTDVLLNISVDKAKITAGGVFTATVKQYDEVHSTWTPCPNATLHADKGYISGPDGKAAIQIFGSGSYDVFAEKDGCVRSDVVGVVVAERSHGGGGGGGPSYYHGRADLFGTTEGYSIVGDGGIEDALEGTSADGVVSVTIGRGTAVRDSEGALLEELSLAVDETPPLPPGNSCLVGQACDFSPPGTTFSPPMTLNWSYTPEALPQYVAEESLAIGYFDAGNDSWVRLDSDVDTAADRVTARVSHFTTFALIGEVAPPPASFSLSDLVIEPARVESGEEVGISALLSNTGGTGGNYTVVLTINGAAEAEKSMALAAGGAERVTFSLAEPPGRYNVSLGELQGSFIVLAPPSWLARWWWAVMAGGLLLVLVISLSAVRRRRA